MCQISVDLNHRLCDMASKLDLSILYDKKFNFMNIIFN